MARHEGWSRGRHEDMEMTAAERLPGLCIRKAERYSGMMGWRKWPIAIVSAALFTEAFLDFPLRILISSMNGRLLTRAEPQGKRAANG